MQQLIRARKSLIHNIQNAQGPIWDRLKHKLGIFPDGRRVPSETGEVLWLPKLVPYYLWCAPVALETLRRNPKRNFDLNKSLNTPSEIYDQSHYNNDSSCEGKCKRVKKTQHKFHCEYAHNEESSGKLEMMHKKEKNDGLTVAFMPSLEKDSKFSRDCKLADAADVSSKSQDVCMPSTSSNFTSEVLNKSQNNSDCLNRTSRIIHRDVVSDKSIDPKITSADSKINASLNPFFDSGASLMQASKSKHISKQYSTANNGNNNNMNEICENDFMLPALNCKFIAEDAARNKRVAGKQLRVEKERTFLTGKGLKLFMLSTLMYKCDYCSLVEKSQVCLKDHLKSLGHPSGSQCLGFHNVDNKSYVPKCITALSSVQYPSALFKVEVLVCPVCSTVFAEMEACVKHAFIFHGLTGAYSLRKVVFNKRFLISPHNQCSKCLKNFVDFDSLLTHWEETKHNNVTPSSKSRVLFLFLPCSYCSHISYNFRDIYHHTQESHTNKFTNNCYINAIYLEEQTPTRHLLPFFSSAVEGIFRCAIKVLRRNLDEMPEACCMERIHLTEDLNEMMNLAATAFSLKRKGVR